MNLDSLKPQAPKKEYSGQVNAHPLKEFFRGKGITQTKIVKLLMNEFQIKVHQSQVSLWLSGLMPMPLEVEQKLQAVADALSEVK